MPTFIGRHGAAHDQERAQHTTGERAERLHPASPAGSAVLQINCNISKRIWPMQEQVQNRLKSGRISVCCSLSIRQLHRGAMSAATTPRQESYPVGVTSGRTAVGPPPPATGSACRASRPQHEAELCRYPPRVGLDRRNVLPASCRQRPAESRSVRPFRARAVRAVRAVCRRDARQHAVRTAVRGPEQRGVRVRLPLGEPIPSRRDQCTVTTDRGAYPTSAADESADEGETRAAKRRRWRQSAGVQGRRSR